MTAGRILTAAGILGALGVAAGAFGAHALAGKFAPADLAIYETAARYHVYQALALLGVGIWADRRPSRALSWAAIAFIAGIAIFSGTLYLLVLTQTRWLGAITPIGGVALILGWLLLAREGLRPTA